jgi:CRISPR-associated protein Csm2
MADQKTKKSFLQEAIEIMGNDQYNEILIPNRKDENKFIAATQKLVRAYKNDISTSQLRNIYSRVKNIKDDNYKEFYLLRPKLAYVSGKADRYGIKKLIALLDNLISQIDSKEKSKQFKYFFESVIAYHKFYGGSN